MTVPKKIYLQILDEDGEIPDEVTWCVDRIHDTDVEYILSSAVPDCVNCALNRGDFGE